MDQSNIPVAGPLQPPQPPTNQPPEATEAVSDRSFLASFAMATVAGWTGLRSFYIKKSALGYIRLLLLSLALLLIFLAIILPISDTAAGMMIGAAIFLFIPIGIWALVDMVHAYVGRPTDAEKKVLYGAMPHDRKIAKTLLTGTIVASVIVLILLIMLVTSIILFRSNSTDDTGNAVLLLGVDRQEALAAYDKITVNSSKAEIEKALKVRGSCKVSYCSYSVNPSEKASREIRRITISYDGDRVSSRTLEDNFVDPGPLIFDKISQDADRIEQDANSTLDNFNTQLNR